MRATGDLASVVRAASRAAADSLARTPELLPQLKAAGVVDAGGRGWCLLLDALEQVVTGVAQPAAPPLLVPRDRSGLARAREAGSDEFAYEVQFLLRETSDAAVEQLKASAGRTGRLARGRRRRAHDLFNVHVHVNDVGAALEAGVDAGRPFRVTVTRFDDQVAQPPAAGRVARWSLSPAETARQSCSATRPAHVVDATARPSVDRRTCSTRSSPPEPPEVVLLPNDANVRAVANAAAEQARQHGIAVQVIPTASVLQGVAAVVAAAPARPFAEDVLGMQKAALACRWAEVTTAQRDAADRCRPVLGRRRPRPRAGRDRRDRQLTSPR